MTRYVICLLLASIPHSALSQAVGSADDSDLVVEMPSGPPEPGAYIVKVLIERKDRNVTDGPLNITYSDGAVAKIGAGEQGRKFDETKFGQQVGFSAETIAADRQTVGWEGGINGGAASYAIPHILYVYRRGRIIFQTEVGSMLYLYQFSLDSKRVGIMWGLPHGLSTSHFELYDLESGNRIDEKSADPNDDGSPQLRAHDPKWAKDLGYEYLHLGD